MVTQSKQSAAEWHEHVFIFNDSECFRCGKTKWELGIEGLAPWEPESGGGK